MCLLDPICGVNVALIPLTPLAPPTTQLSQNRLEQLFSYSKYSVVWEMFSSFLSGDDNRVVFLFYTFSKQSQIRSCQLGLQLKGFSLFSLSKSPP